MDKFVFCSDVHFRDDPPRCYRSMGKEEWSQYQFGIFKEVLDIAEKHDAALGIAGDVFNTPDVSLLLLTEIIDLVKSYYDMDIYASYGQHDLRNHSMRNLYGTPLHLLYKTDTFTDCLAPFNCFSWEEKITSNSDYDVCMAHKTVWMKPPFPGADPSGNVKNFKDYGYNLMVFGDNHSPFITSVGKTQILNCGSLIRQSYAETHSPACYLWKNGMIETIRVTNREFDTEEFSISDNTSIIENVQSSDGCVSFKKNVESLARNVKPFIAKKALNIVDRSE